jgi:hypothetical protein
VTRLFRQDYTCTSALISEIAVKTADEATKGFSAVFAETDATLKKSRSNTLGQLMRPFRDNKIDLSRSHIDKMKDTLQVLISALTHADRGGDETTMPDQGAIRKQEAVDEEVRRIAQ